MFRRDHLQPVGGEALQAGRSAAGRAVAVNSPRPHLGCLPAHRRRQQPVAVAEPFVERFLGAACAPRHRGHGQRVALLDQQAQHGVEHVLLALGQFLAWGYRTAVRTTIRILRTQVPMQDASVPYVTVRLYAATLVVPQPLSRSAHRSMLQQLAAGSATWNDRTNQVKCSRCGIYKLRAKSGRYPQHRKALRRSTVPCANCSALRIKVAASDLC